jgi:hypothetical protein
VILLSVVNQVTMKLEATRVGRRIMQLTRANHQWRYSFKNRKKFHVNKITVIRTVKIPIVTAPHLIGKQPQHEASLVNSLEQTQMQQQHGSFTGSA